MQLMFKNSHIKDCRAIRDEVLNLLFQHDYQSLPPEGLLSPVFPDTFAPSAFHGAVLRGAMHPESSPRVGCDWVFRHVDLEKIGFSDIHLSTFRMIVFFETHQNTNRDKIFRLRTLETFIFILKKLGLNPIDLYITYFGGGFISGQHFEADDEIKSAWIHVGVAAKNIIPVRGSSHFTNVLRSGEPAGPRCEVYWLAGQNQPIEIGTVVFEQFILKKNNLRFEPSKGLVCGGAIGLERLNMIVSKKQDVFSTQELQPLIKQIEREIHPKLIALCRNSIRQSADAVRSLTIISSMVDVSKIGKRHHARLTRLAKSLRHNIDILGINDARLFIIKLINQCVLQEKLDCNSEALAEALIRNIIYPV